MINILYWNAGIRTEEDRHSIRGENVRQKIIELILENNIDIVILAEYTFDMKLMCDMLSVNGKDFKTAPVPFGIISLLYSHNLCLNQSIFCRFLLYFLHKFLQILFYMFHKQCINRLFDCGVTFSK